MTAILRAIVDRDLVDIAGKLRQLAKRIDGGEIIVGRCAIVLRTPEGPQVLGLGASADATHVFEDLHLGAAHLLDMLKAGETS